LSNYQFKETCPVFTAARGDECEMSGLKMFYGPDAKTSEIGYTRVEDQEKVRAEAVQIGRRIGERLQKQQHGPLN